MQLRRSGSPGVRWLTTPVASTRFHAPYSWPARAGKPSKARPHRPDRIEIRTGRYIKFFVGRSNGGASAADAADRAYQRGKSRAEEIRRTPLQHDISTLERTCLVYVGETVRSRRLDHAQRGLFTVYGRSDKSIHAYAAHHVRAEYPVSPPRVGTVPRRARSPESGRERCRNRRVFRRCRVPPWPPIRRMRHPQDLGETASRD